MTIHDGDKRSTILYSRYLMEKKMGRELSYDETVDHVDEDPTNDSIENLQVISRSENAQKYHRFIGTQPEIIEITCGGCGKKSMKLARNIRGNLKKGRGGPFCGRSCAGRYSMTGERRTKFIHGTLVAYQYNKCRCKLCRGKNAQVVRERRNRKKRD